MSDTQLLPGDLVILRAEVGRMTIDSIEGDQAICKWTEGSKDYKEAISLTVLKKPREENTRDPFFDKVLFRR